MTVEELHRKLGALVDAGHGDTPVTLRVSAGERAMLRSNLDGVTGEESLRGGKFRATLLLWGREA